MSNTSLIIKLRTLGFELQYNDSLELTHVVVPANVQGFSIATIWWDDIISISYEDWNKI